MSLDSLADLCLNDVLFLKTGFAFLAGASPFFFSVVEELLVFIAGSPDFSLYAVDGVLELRLFQLAFPDDDHTPACGFQFTPYALVAFLVACYFCGPVIRVGLRHLEDRTVLMPMPEATVDEDDSTILGKYNVWLAR